MKVQISLLYQKKKTLQTSFKPVLNCKKVGNIILKNIFQRSKFLKKK